MQILVGLFIRHSSGSANEFGIIAGVAVFVVLGLIVLSNSVRSSRPALARSTAPVKSSLGSSEVQHLYPALYREASSNSVDDVDREATDREFESVIGESIPEAVREKWFYAKVAGSKHRNDDKTSRTRIISQCGIFEGLELRPEPENPFDPNAVSVRRAKTGEQLGYLDARLAGEVTRDRARRVDRWAAFFRQKNSSPETGKVAGAVILIVKLSEDFVSDGKAVPAEDVNRT